MLRFTRRRRRRWSRIEWSLFIALLLGTYLAYGRDEAKQRAHFRFLVADRACSESGPVVRLDGDPGSPPPSVSGVVGRLLDEEHDVYPVTPLLRVRLDRLVASGAASLPAIPQGISGPVYERFALTQLRTIDCELVRAGFVYPPYGQTDLLAQALEPKHFTTPAAIKAVIKRNSHLSAFVNARGKRPFYIADCDIMSLLVIAIARHAGYPVTLVFLPGHAFVRWEAPTLWEPNIAGNVDGRLDFEATQGTLATDATELRFTGTPARLAYRGNNLASLDDKQLLGSYDALNFAYAAQRYPASTLPKFQFLLERAYRRAPLNYEADLMLWYSLRLRHEEPRQKRRLIELAERAQRYYPDTSNTLALACMYEDAGAYGRAQTFGTLASGYARDEHLTKQRGLVQMEAAIARHRPCMARNVPAELDLPD